MNDLFKYLYYKFTSGKKQWYPLISVYYLTYRCMFRCPYCSDGAGKPYYQLDSPDPSAEEAVRYLKRIREFSNHVVITGGEPLQHPGFMEVMEQLPSMKFKEIILTTNGYHVETYLPLIAQSVNTLVFSIDTLDEGKADQWHAVGPGSFRGIMENIEKAQQYISKKFRITISAVATPHNIRDLYEVYEYARERGYELAAAPQLVGVKAHRDLVDNPEYIKFFDFLIREKKRGGKVFGTVCYLEYMRDLKKFRCYPFTMLVVGPNGEVFYPCLEIGHHCGNILEPKTLREFRLEGEERFGPQPQCDTRCHSACALSFSLFLQNPLPFVVDFFRLCKQ